MIKFAIGISVYNSYQNLDNIFNNIEKAFLNEDYKLDILVIDNASKLDYKKKEKIISSLKNKYKFQITLILNEKNYGMGGSQKIILDYVKKKTYDYYVNLHSSGRFDSLKVLNDIIFKERFKNSDYIIFSRFLKKKDTENYSFKRYYGNKFFIILTSIISKCKISDPGGAIYCVKVAELNKIDFYNLTNSSQFNHLMNIIISNVQLSIEELSIKWGEGTVKSHLNEFVYGIELFKILIKYFFTKKFTFNSSTINEKNIENLFKFRINKF